MSADYLVFGGDVVQAEYTIDAGPVTRAYWEVCPGGCCARLWKGADTICEVLSRCGGGEDDLHRHFGEPIHAMFPVHGAREALEGHWTAMRLDAQRAALTPPVKNSTGKVARPESTSITQVGAWPELVPGRTITRSRATAIPGPLPLGEGQRRDRGNQRTLSPDAGLSFSGSRSTAMPDARRTVLRRDFGGRRNLEFNSGADFIRSPRLYGTAG